MKIFKIARVPRPTPFAEKFSAEGEFFGSREKKEPKCPPWLGRLPVILLGMLGGAALVSVILKIGRAHV